MGQRPPINLGRQSGRLPGVVPGGPVGFISNLSGNGRNGVMGASVVAGGDAFRPTYQANFQRGMPGIFFDGLDDFTSLGNSLVDGASAMTVAFAINGGTAALAGHRIWGASDGVNGAGVTFTSEGRASASAILKNNGVAFATDTAAFPFATPGDGDYSMPVVARIQPGGTSTIWTNGILGGSANSPAGANNIIRSLQKELLGAANGASTVTDLAPLAGSHANFRFLEGIVTTSPVSDQVAS